MASLQDLQANFNAAFDVLPVGQRIPWGGGTIYSMGGGRAYYDGPNGYQVLSKGQDVAQIAAANPNIAQQWAGEGYDLAPAQTFSTRPEQVMQAPEPVSVAAPATSTGSPASGPQFDAAGQYFGQGTDQAGYSGTFQDPATGQYMSPRYETRYNPQTGDVESVQAGWYAANGQNVGDMMNAYDKNGNADAANNVAIADTSDTLLDKLIKGGILAGAGMGLGQLAGIGGQVAGAGDAFMPGALDATGAVIGDATMPGALASFGANPATTSLGALAVGTGDAFLPGALNAATGTVLGDAYLPGALGSFGANPALTGASGHLSLGGLGGGTSALSSGTAGTSGVGAAGTGTGSGAVMGPPTSATTPAGLEQYLKKPNVLDTIGSALGINGGTAATILGGLLGGQSNDESKTTANKLDPQMQAYLYGSGGLLPAVNSTLQSQLANGGLNALQRQGLTAQQNYLQSPEYAQQFAGLRNYGQGLLASGVAANPFATRGTNGLL
jgi:hypothetical protein